MYAGEWLDDNFQGDKMQENCQKVKMCKEELAWHKIELYGITYTIWVELTNKA